MNLKHLMINKYTHIFITLTLLLKILVSDVQILQDY